MQRTVGVEEALVAVEGVCEAHQAISKPPERMDVGLEDSGKDD